MVRVTTYLMAFFLLGLTVGLSGCYVTPVRYVHVEPAYGPPPHAPAHGYRHRLPDGQVIVYDTSIHVYIVSGYSNVYYADGSYYRYTGNRWEASHSIGKPWKTIEHRRIPPGLREKGNRRVDEPGDRRRGKPVAEQDDGRDHPGSAQPARVDTDHSAEHPQQQQARHEGNAAVDARFVKLEPREANSAKDSFVAAKPKPEIRHQQEQAGLKDREKDKARGAVSGDKDAAPDRVDTTEAPARATDKPGALAAVGKDTTQGKDERSEAASKAKGKIGDSGAVTRDKAQSRTEKAKAVVKAKDKTKKAAAKKKKSGEQDATDEAQAADEAGGAGEESVTDGQSKPSRKPA